MIQPRWTKTNIIRQPNPYQLQTSDIYTTGRTLQKWHFFFLTSSPFLSANSRENFLCVISRATGSRSREVEEMELEVRVVGGIESCFVSLPLPFIQTLQSTHLGFLPPVLALELRSRRTCESWHLAWSGSASRSPAIEVIPIPIALPFRSFEPRLDVKRFVIRLEVLKILGFCLFGSFNRKGSGQGIIGI